MRVKLVFKPRSSFPTDHSKMVPLLQFFLFCALVISCVVLVLWLLFLSPSFGTLGMLCFMILVFPEYFTYFRVFHVNRPLGRQFTWNVKPYFLWEIQKNKMLSAQFRFSNTTKMPKKTCIWKCCLFLSSAEYSCKLFKPIFAYRQTVWTLIRLLLESDLGPHCLQKWLLKSQADDKADHNCCDWQFKG